MVSLGKTVSGIKEGPTHDKLETDQRGQGIDSGGSC